MLGTRGSAIEIENNHTPSPFIGKKNNAASDLVDKDVGRGAFLIHKTISDLTVKPDLDFGYEEQKPDDPSMLSLEAKT